MRVAVDGSCWANRRGFGRFTRCLVTEMLRRDTLNDYVLVVDSATASAPELHELPAGADLAIARVSAPPSRAAASNGSRKVVDMLRMAAGVRRAGCDVAFFPASYSYFPVLGPPVVVTVHDAIAERLPQLTVPRRADRVRWRLKQQAALRQARAVITVSEASRQAILETLGVRPDRLHVIREAPAPVFRPLSASERSGSLESFGPAAAKPYFLYVGGISPHKNVEVLVEAFGLVAKEHPSVRLILAGELDDDPFLSAAASIRAAVGASWVADRIALVGYVPDEDLVALYSGAVATALPSLGEGFGLTAAESAACGTPVVASRDPALVELLGDAGVYVDVRSPHELASAMSRLLADAGHRAGASEAVLSRAASWSWAAAADTTVAVLTEVASRAR